MLKITIDEVLYGKSLRLNLLQISVRKKNCKRMKASMLALDSAFDRRILFKLKLENPKEETKKKIWKSKLETLSDEDLAKVVKYDFSGGQIENIRRKITLDEVLYGTQPSIETILDFCKKERLIKEDSKHIGFSV